MTEQKRPVGRPRKTPAVELHREDGSVKTFHSFEEMKDFVESEMKTEPVKNPDCEPATRGYVKCLLRKNREHKHEQNACADLSGMSAAFGWIATIAVWLLSYSTTPPSELAVLDAWLVPLFLFSVAMTVVVVSEEIYIGTSLTTSVKGECPKEIQKWQPPTCERKKDCDE